MKRNRVEGMKGNRHGKYVGDTRYEKVWEQMQLLGIQDVTTDRQDDNGTIVWRLPIKNNWPGNNKSSYIEVGSFKTGYVRNQNSGYSNYQLNKRIPKEEFFKDYKITWNDNNTDYTQEWTGKYRKFITRTCELIPIEIDRLEYLISYCLKNYYIKRANEVVSGDYIPKWKHEHDLETIEKVTRDEGALQNLSVTVNGERYKII